MDINKYDYQMVRVITDESKIVEGFATTGIEEETGKEYIDISTGKYIEELYEEDIVSIEIIE